VSVHDQPKSYMIFFLDKVSFMFLNIFARSGSGFNLHYIFALICTHEYFEFSSNII